jgi:hypothetical protein
MKAVKIMLSDIDSDKKKFIAQHALQNKENLLLSLDIYNSFEEVMNNLVSIFLNELKKQLLENLGDEWEISLFFENNNVFGKGEVGLEIWKKLWKEKHVVAFSNDKTKLGDFNFFVWREAKTPIRGITETLNTKFIKGYKYGEYIDWYVYVDKKYANWLDEDTISLLYDKKEMLEYFKDNLLKIAKIVEPIIDKKFKV